MNTSPVHAHHRYVINFRDYPLRREDLGESWVGATDDQRREWLRRGIVPLDYPDPVAADWPDWPDLLAIVEERVRPTRMTDNREVYRRYWWQYAEKRLELTSVIVGLERVLAISRIGNAFRAAFMERNREGLTRTYNRFHDPHEDAPEIASLRSLHAAMDWAVLDAYGWRDIPTECEFLLDYEIGEEERGAKKKPYRYRWPDEVRDEVLARLLELNAQRAAEEARSGKVVTAVRQKTEPPSTSTSAGRAGASRAAEPRPLWGTSDD